MANINQEAQVFNTLTDSFKVRLQESVSYRDSRESQLRDRAGDRLTKVIFDVTPDLSENRVVDYKTMQPIHMPGQIYVYGSTNSRTFQLSNVRLVSRTVKEATKNMNILWTLRGWTMPYFGQSDTLSEIQGIRRQNLKFSDFRGQNPEITKTVLGQQLLGKPPNVLLLSAYSSLKNYASDGSRRTRGHPTNINNVPVVVTNLTIPYPSEVDYVPTIDGQPIPRVMAIDIALAETQAPKQLENFSLQEYRRGILDQF